MYKCSVCGAPVRLEKGEWKRDCGHKFDTVIAVVEATCNGSGGVK